MVKIIFDFDLQSPQKYGIAYAVLEQMRSLQALGQQTVNLAAGLNSLSEHQKLLQASGLPTLTVPWPKKLLNLASALKLPWENLACREYDYFLQIGLQYWRNIPRQKYVLAVHDTVGLRYPENEAPFPRYAQALLNYAHKIITVSEFSKKELLHFFALPAEKIFVVPNGCNLDRFNQKNDPVQFQLLQKKYQLPPKYFLAYGGASPRKNLPFLIKVFENLKPAAELVIFGGYQYKGNNQNIRSLGYLAEPETELILKNAFALVFPSYYEGFGLPVLEAMNCGIPVLCTRQAALPEVSGDQALYFDGFQPADLTEKIYAILNQSDLRQKLIRQGLQWGQNFTWEKSAQKLLAALKQ